MKDTKTSIVLGLAALLALGACACEAADSASEDQGGDADSDGDSDSDSDGDSDGDSDSDSDSDSDNTGCAEIDILFVIDDSGSMECEQLMLAEAFPAFIEVLEQYNNSNADQVAYRVGVTTTGRDVSCWEMDPYGDTDTYWNEGVNGELMQTASSLKWLDGPGDVDQLSEQFSELADVGTGGADPEMPLDSMRLAIEKVAAGEPNDGFLREDALFVLVIITDEDDYSLSVDSYECGSENFPWESIVPLVDYQTFLDERFGGPDRYVVAVIAGAELCTETDWASSCEEGDEYLGALHAQRLETFIEENIEGGGGNGLFADICTTDPAGALSDALDLVTVACDEYPVE